MSVYKCVIYSNSKQIYFWGLNFNLRYLQRLAIDSQIPLLTTLNSPSSKPHFCCTQLSSKQNLAGSSSLLDWPLIFLPVSVLEAISSSVKSTFASSIPTWMGAEILGFNKIGWILSSTDAILVAWTLYDLPLRSDIGALALVDGVARFLALSQMRHSSRSSLFRTSVLKEAKECWRSSSCCILGEGLWKSSGNMSSLLILARQRKIAHPGVKIYQ